MITGLSRRNRIGLLAVILWGVLPAFCPAQTPPRLEATVSSNQVFLSTSTHAQSVLSLNGSTNLGNWQSLGVFHDAILPYPDLRSNASVSFYRVQATPRVPTNDWKNQTIHPEEPFRRPAMGMNDVEWVKFLILLDDPTRVYYQDSARFPFHYDFATQRLPQFKDMDRSTFDSISLFRTNQQVVLGAILSPPGGNPVEYGIQFVGFQPFTPEEIARWYSLVKATVYSSNGAGVYYVPSFEQSEMTRTNKAAFDALGVPVSSIERWIPGNHCYSPGWALGTLKFFTASEIATAYTDGRLKPQDILLTDGVPAETPLVAGIISLRPSTPNAHTAILARSFGIPFVYFADTADQARLQALVGRKIILRAMVTFASTDLTLFDVEGALTPDVENQLLALKAVAPISYRPKETLGSLSQSTDNMTPENIRFFGGKAANYGFLRREVPTNSPPAIAFSFDSDAFMSQTRPGKTVTLREEIPLCWRRSPITPGHERAETCAGASPVIDNSSRFLQCRPAPAITNALVVFEPQRRSGSAARPTWRTRSSSPGPACTTATAGA
jgi:hypothetical protein